MKNNLVLIFTFFVLLFLFGKFGPGLPLSVNQITTAQPAPFTVTAEGKVTAIPDIAQVSVGFSTTGTNVSTVQNQANLIIKNVTSAVKNTGIDSKDIQTTNYNLSPNYDLQRINGYSINVNLQIKVRDFSKINQVIDAATANGANQVSGLNFTFDNPEKFQSEARKIAIDNAKKKATEIAGESGITLGRLINVQESSNYNPRPMPMMAAAAEKMTTPTQIEPGSSEITSSVILSYETR